MSNKSYVHLLGVTFIKMLRKGRVSNCVSGKMVIFLNWQHRTMIGDDN